MKEELLKIIENESAIAALTKDLTTLNTSKTINCMKTKELLKILLQLYDKKKYRELNTISIRIGAIAVIEEMLLEKNDRRRSILDYYDVIKKTRVRFYLNIKNRDISKFETVDKIHPQYPCNLYETLTKDKKVNISNAKRKSKYLEAISKIILGSEWILENPLAYKSFKRIYNEVKDC
ncbi:hypothetical protein [Polaribacter cellanae]|uniref:Uncharacterized protein n=1 Tax=Polaribacter cellanae TaxID=2818493 RepID=A0A975CKZ4_9FLAO|nr:hypothetical protein [Polaribacter cellanae]QTE21022.1 hypothetical protein J3359_09175 [Polaribacter cellanae]